MLLASARFAQGVCVAFLDIAREEGEGFETGISLAMHAILLSPHFIYRVELDPALWPDSCTLHQGPITLGIGAAKGHRRGGT